MRSSAVTTVALLALTATAEAGIGGLYIDVGVGYGSLSGQNLIVLQEAGSPDFPVPSGSEGCCPEGGLALDLRLGLKLFDTIAPELGLVATGWRIGGDKRGGAGFPGGGLRFFPFGLIDLIADTELADFPLNLNFGGIVGYAIAGQDFAFSGIHFGFDATIGWRIVEVFSLNLRGLFLVPQFDAFVYTDYDKNIGRCLDSAGVQIGPPDQDNVHTKGQMACDSTGSGPSARYLSAELVATFHFDIF